MRVCAQREDGNTYLLDLEDGYGGQVLELAGPRLHAPGNLASILARGGWDPPEADDVPDAALERAVREYGEAEEQEYAARRSQFGADMDQRSLWRAEVDALKGEASEMSERDGLAASSDAGLPSWVERREASAVGNEAERSRSGISEATPGGEAP